MKRLLLVLSLLSLAVGGAAWLAWSQNLLPDSGTHGEKWDKWNSAINTTWTIIEISFPASIVFGILYLAVKPRSKRALACGLSVVGLAVVAPCAIWFIMTHLGIG